MRLSPVQSAQVRIPSKLSEVILLTRVSPITSIMRFIPLLALLPALAVAEDQVPLGDRVQGWFNKAKAYLPTATPVIPVAEKVVETPKKVVQEKTVYSFNTTNWESLLEPKSTPQDWLVFVTGGNKTCFGRCGKAEESFNVSAPNQPAAKQMHFRQLQFRLTPAGRDLFSSSPRIRLPPTWVTSTVNRTRFSAPPGLLAPPPSGTSSFRRFKTRKSAPPRLCTSSTRMRPL